MDLPGYDAWKLASPPEYDEVPAECPKCASSLVTIGLICSTCGWDGEDAGNAYDTLEEAEMDR